MGNPSQTFHDFLARLVSSRIARIRLRQKTYPAITRQYGHLRLGENWRDSSVRGTDNESGIVMGWVVKSIQRLAPAPGSILLAGEGASAKPVYAEIAGVPVERVTTGGLHGDADFRWNFEESPPEGVGPFDCIVSYAILEHLLDPWGHVRDLGGLLAPGGSLILYTVGPGFPYHRHPVDCLRFFPDWFEEAADRLRLAVAECLIGEDHIVYRLSKTESS